MNYIMNKLKLMSKSCITILLNGIYNIMSIRRKNPDFKSIVIGLAGGPTVQELLQGLEKL